LHAARSEKYALETFISITHFYFKLMYHEARLLFGTFDSEGNGVFRRLSGAIYFFHPVKLSQVKSELSLNRTVYFLKYKISTSFVVLPFLVNSQKLKFWDPSGSRYPWIPRLRAIVSRNERTRLIVQRWRSLASCRSLRRHNFRVRRWWFKCTEVIHRRFVKDGDNRC